MEKKHLGIRRLFRKYLGDAFSNLDRLPWFPWLVLLNSAPAVSRVLGVPEGSVVPLKRDLAGLLGVKWHEIEDVLELGEKSLEKIRTGAPLPSRLGSLDAILGGGFKRGLIVEFFGKSNTLISRLVARAMVAFLERGGRQWKNSRVIVLDTDQNFQPEVILEVGGSLETLRDILVSKCYSPLHLKSQLKSAGKLRDKGVDIPLVVLNSLPFSSLFLESDDQFVNIQVLGEILSSLRKIADDWNSCVIIKNPAVGPDGYPAGGYLMTLVPSLLLRVDPDPWKPGQCIVRLCKGPGLPEAECRVQP